MMSEEAIAIYQSIDRLTATMKELVVLVAKHAEAAAAAPTDSPEMKELLKMDAPPTAPAVPEKPPTAAPPKTTLTSVPPLDSLCRCMHQSREHVDGVGACSRTSCTCQKFAYMVAPQPTPGACANCGCAPSQVKMIEGVVPPICESCHNMANLLKPKAPTPEPPKV